jgi:hypothetical protein
MAFVLSLFAFTKVTPFGSFIYVSVAILMVFVLSKGLWTFVRLRKYPIIFEVAEIITAPGREKLVPLSKKPTDLWISVSGRLALVDGKYECLKPDLAVFAEFFFKSHRFPNRARVGTVRRVYRIDPPAELVNIKISFQSKSADPIDDFSLKMIVAVQEIS